jgi:putative nucleotidyltransferase with HDIG domain
MQEFLKLRPLARTYVATVVLLGVATLLHSAYAVYSEPIGSQWFILAALTLLTGSFTVKVPSINASLSVSETFVFASVLIFGPAAGAMTVLLECLIILFWMKPGGRPLHRILFNTAAPAIAIWVSGSVFFLLSGLQPHPDKLPKLESLLFPLVIFTALYFLLNSWLVAIALGFETKKSPFEIWWKNFIWLSVNYFSGASVAALLVTYSQRFDPSTLAIIVPLLVVSYLTFRTAMGRVEDAGQHLTELNRLYLSTIETLAMAIDAKDQVTHGHIRRVQTYATGLAREVGVRDERLLKAIEAAALLHDMGKLAVPEYILNKPGKLTAAEFEKMKLHASVGADILSAIDFPYPVVPIVRHHHENWDGSGYPSGLKGTDIPIGARILAVVDCFDALTSDRPYRPRLTDADALSILEERRGIWYDPLVVDTFVRVHDSIAPEPLSSGPPSYALNEIVSARKAVPPAGSPIDEITASSDETLTLYELARDLSGRTNPSESVDVIANHLRRLVPHSLCAFFIVDVRTSELELMFAIGNGASLVKGLRIPLGQRLSGWVAANRQTILNSDPLLDFGDAARRHALGLKSCISTPLLQNDDVLGVLSLYSAETSGFSEDHRRIVEAVATQTVRALSHREELLRASRFDLNGLPRLSQLADMVNIQSARNVGRALLAVSLESGKRTPDGIISGSDEILAQVAETTKNQLAKSDHLFFDGRNTFFVLLESADQGRAISFAARVRSVLSSDLEKTPGRPPLTISVRVLDLAVNPASVAAVLSDESLKSAFGLSQKGSHVH